MPRPKRKPTNAAPVVTDYSWRWIGGSFAVGAGVLAVDSQIIIPPLVGAILWLAAFVMLVIGSWKSGPLARVAAVLVGGFLAYNLWQASSPHADVRFTGTPQITVDPATGVITGLVTYENRGEWKATIRPVMWVGTEPEDTANSNADSYLKTSTKVMEVGPESESLSYEGQHKSRYPVEVYSKPDGPTILIAARIAYSDWWPFERVSRLCVFIPPGTNRIAYCSRGTDGISRRSGR